MVFICLREWEPGGQSVMIQTLATVKGVHRTEPMPRRRTRSRMDSVIKNFFCTTLHHLAVILSVHFVEQ